jgi:hypothetical protein
VQRTFTVQFSGTLPFINKLANVGGVDLRGKPVVVITLSTGQQLFFVTDGTATLAIMNAFPNGAIPINDFSTTSPVLICFLRGTRIRTPAGDVPVEELAAGDLVLTHDGRAVPLLWTGSRTVSADDLRRFPALRPIRLPAGSLGKGSPARDLYVSPQHRVLMTGWKAELLFGLPEILVPAKALAGDIAGPALGTEAVEYFHLVCERHEIILSEGQPTETLNPTEENIRDLPAEARADLMALMPEGLAPSDRALPDAAPTLRRYEGEVLARF